MQKPNETLREYYYALLDLISKITKRDSSWMPNKDTTLCDQFSQNVQDIILQKHLKRIVRSQPAIHFLDLREEAIMWSEGEECIESFNTKHGVTSTPAKPLSEVCTVRNTIQSDEKNDKYDKIVDIVLKQSEQIEALTRIVSRKQTSNVYHGNNVRYDTQRSQQQRTFLCYGCNKPGHRIADCPTNRKSEN